MSDSTAEVPYVTVDGLGYDETNKKLMLKVNGADSVIPFSGDSLQGKSFETICNHAYESVTTTKDYAVVCGFCWGYSSTRGIINCSNYDYKSDIDGEQGGSRSAGAGIFINVPQGSTISFSNSAWMSVVGIPKN